MSLAQLEALAERRSDDLCDIGSTSTEEIERMQLATMSSQEYAQLYATYISHASQLPASHAKTAVTETAPIDNLDAEELLIQTLSERQKLAEVGKLVGMARYALGGHDTALLQDTRRRIEQFARSLPEKYRGAEIVKAATAPEERGAKLAELYLSRAYKLLDEDYAEIPRIESAIRELKEE
ncbi:hypothetical protein KDI_27260 [Dictyobacter arantiisoli]|uniref:Uncharacterized protein n=2 Tax=Dictyobacter arantiisoli TaxID=2014874 RepID=A0A5A5TCI6_9CHLR|nr:hypothetical protein KDI_27260 [Dictyobacter arantiisoli]